MFPNKTKIDQVVSVFFFYENFFRFLVTKYSKKKSLNVSFTNVRLRGQKQYVPCDVMKQWSRFIFYH